MNPLQWIIAFATSNNGRAIAGWLAILGCVGLFFALDELSTKVDALEDKLSKYVAVEDYTEDRSDLRAALVKIETHQEQVRQDLIRSLERLQDQMERVLIMMRSSASRTDHSAMPTPQMWATEPAKAP